MCKERFTDFDEFTYALQAWDLDFKQLDTGTCSTDVLQFACGNSLLDHARFSRRFDQHGSPPQGKWTFAIFAERSPSLIWHEQKISNNTIAVFKPGSEMDCVTLPRFEVFTLSYPEDHLNEISTNFGLPEMKILAGGTDYFTCNPQDLFETRRRLQQIIDVLNRHSSEIDFASFTDTMNADLPEQILLTLSRSLPPKCSPLRTRNRAIKRIKEHLAEFPHEPVTVNQLSKIAMVSIRTLQYAFTEHYGVGPKTYLKNLRLNNVRRELWNSDPVSTRVNDVSSLWGFWHMGQFAADYRKLFGELPSETLKRRREGERGHPLKGEVVGY